MKRIYTQPLDAKVDALETKASDLEKAVQKCPYRIGDVLMTFNETHPGTSWPGTTWERLDDRFLIGAGNTYALDATGGSTTKNLQHSHKTGDHTLTADESGQRQLTITGGGHSHKTTIPHDQSGYGVTIPANSNYLTWNTGVKWTGSAMSNRNATTSYTSSSESHSHTVSAASASKAHNHGNTGNGGSTTQDIMPPYRAVYMYRRLT